MELDREPTIEIAFDLPSDLNNWVEEQVKSGRVATEQAYFQYLIEQDFREYASTEKS